MYLIRDIMSCKPGQVRPMVDKFKALNKAMKKMGFGKMRLLTDFSGERYWTVVSELEVNNLEEYTEMSRTSMKDKDFQKAMKGYHDHVAEGRREIYIIEA